MEPLATPTTEVVLIDWPESSGVVLAAFANGKEPAIAFIPSDEVAALGAGTLTVAASGLAEPEAGEPFVLKAAQAMLILPLVWMTTLVSPKKAGASLTVER